MRWKAKVAHSLADVWQQLFEQQDIAVICIIHFQPWLHENHTSAPEPGNTDWNWCTGTCLSEASEGRQWDDWNVVSNQQSFIGQATDPWRDCFNACLEVKSKHWIFVMMCFSATVMTFKAYATAVMNNLTYVSFNKVGWEQPSGEVGNFVAVLLQIYFSICMPKIIEI